MTDYGHPITFGLSLIPSVDTLEETKRLTQTADAAGLDYLAIQDHAYNPEFFDAWTLISYLAAETSRITFVPDVADLQLRPPTILAKAAASLRSFIDVVDGGQRGIETPVRLAEGHRGVGSLAERQPPAPQALGVGRHDFSPRMVARRGSARAKASAPLPWSPGPTASPVAAPDFSSSISRRRWVGSKPPSTRRNSGNSSVKTSPARPASQSSTIVRKRGERRVIR